MNPFWAATEDQFRSEQALVYTEDLCYHGWIDRFNHNEESVLLRGASVASRQTGTDVRQVGDAYISEYQAITRVDTQSCETVEEVPVADISLSPLNCRDFSEYDLTEYIEKTRNRGHLPSFPTVRPVDDDETPYETILGNKRVYVAKQASLETIPVVIDQYSAWEAAELFIGEHVPSTENQRNRREFYDPKEVVRLVERLTREFDRDQLEDTAIGLFLPS